jgi:hypothetical protein
MTERVGPPGVQPPGTNQVRGLRDYREDLIGVAEVEFAERERSGRACARACLAAAPLRKLAFLQQSGVVKKTEIGAALTRGFASVATLARCSALHFGFSLCGTPPEAGVSEIATIFSGMFWTSAANRHIGELLPKSLYGAVRQAPAAKVGPKGHRRLVDDPVMRKENADLR